MTSLTPASSRRSLGPVAMARLLCGVLALFPALSTPLPQPQGENGPGEGGPPAAPPSVQSMTMTGPGCPVGAGGLIQQIRNDMPVFLFTEWNLALPNAAGGNITSQDAKWCTETIQLANGPPGMQVRIATVSIGGWAELEPETKLRVDVSTLLGNVAGGSRSVTITQADLKAGNFTLDLHTQPNNVWSACVDEKGTVPALNIQTRLTLSGGMRADGTSSVGVVGSSNKTDLSRALAFQFRPLWRKCPEAAPTNPA